MGTEPASVDALVAWLNGLDGPGIASAKGLDEQLRSEAEVLKGAAVASFEEYHAARVWAIVTKANDTPLDGLDVIADSSRLTTMSLRQPLATLCAVPRYETFEGGACHRPQTQICRITTNP
eukprot:SAG11_NODE_1194_length_5548_cov_3.456414_1_plen_121_part_00